MLHTPTRSEHTAEEWVELAYKQAPAGGRFLRGERSEQIMQAQYCATMAVYEKLAEIAKLLER